MGSVAVHCTQVIGWGRNVEGQTNIPQNLTNAILIAAGNFDSLAVRSDGTVAEWGDSFAGALNIAPSATNVINAVVGENNAFAVRSNGTVVGWGWNLFSITNVPTDLTNAVKVSTDGTHAIAMRSNGQVTVWGANSYGLGIIPPFSNSIIDVAAGTYHDLALTSSGQVVAWGNNSYKQSTVPNGLSNVVAIAAADDVSVALKLDGKVVAWGDNTAGRTNVPAGLSNVVAIAAGMYHVLALKSDGHVVGWGDNNFGEITVPAAVSNAVGIAGGDDHSLALVNDGSPAIVRQPASQSIDPGATLSLNVGAVGMPMLSYQWFFNGSPVTDATNWVLSVTNFQSTNAGSYSVLVSNSLNAVTSAPANIVYGIAPRFIVQPTDQYVLPGATGALTTIVSGSPSLIYQWFNTGNAVPAGTTNSLTIANAQSTDTGTYQLIVSNEFGSATSQPVVFSVVTNVAVVTSPPTNRIVQAGSNTTFVVSVVSGNPPSYQWRFQGTNVANATSSSYSVTAQLTNTGAYDVVISNLAGIATSSSGLLDVFTRPLNITVQPGGPVTFSSTYSGPIGLSAQWVYNGSPLADATNLSITLSNVSYSDTGYYAISYTGGGTSGTSVPTRLSVVDTSVNTNGPLMMPAGMVNWWPADGNGNDIYGSDNITNQTPLRYTQGQVQQAFIFTNNNSAYSPIGASNIPPPWTACFWLNRQDAPGNSAALFMNDCSLKIEQYPTTRKVGITKYGPGGYDLIYNYTAPTNTWVHLSFVGTATETMLFVNGLFQDSLPVSQPLCRNSLGSASGFDIFRGSVDEIMVFNRALTDSEVYAVAAGGRVGLVKAPQFVGLTHGDGSVMLTLIGQTGKTISVYSSTNLVDWLFLGAQPTVGGGLHFIDVPAALPIFYRATQP